MDKLIYLSSPYTHESTMVMEARWLESLRAAAWLFTNCPDHYALSPIAHTHPIAVRYKLPVEWEFWANYDTLLVGRSDECWVLCIPGYRNSTGINAEKALAVKFGKPIKYLVPSGASYVVQSEDPELG